MFKKTPALVAIALAAALWMLSGGALYASAQGSSVGSASEALPGGAVPAGSTFIPDGTTAADGTVIPSGSILLFPGSMLADGTVVVAGMVLYPDGNIYMFSDSGSWPAGSMVPNTYAFAPTSLPFTGGSQGILALVGGSLIVIGAGAYVAQKRLSPSAS